MEDNQPSLKENIAKLISEYNELREDKFRLLGRIDSLTKEVADYKEALRELKKKYERLMVAKTVESSKADVAKVSKRLSELEQEIEYCITLLMK
jgi:predicted nuclease with TOPRIM domain